MTASSQDSREPPAADVEAINQLKLLKVYSNPTDIAFSDTDSTSRLAISAGIKLGTDFTTRTNGGHTDSYWNEVFRKIRPPAVQMTGIGGRICRCKAARWVRAGISRGTAGD